LRNICWVSRRKNTGVKVLGKPPHDSSLSRQK
jgi:hypothetical protein